MNENRVLWVPEPGVLFRRIVGNRVIDVVALTFDRARICIGAADNYYQYNDGW